MIASRWNGTRPKPDGMAGQPSHLLFRAVLRKPICAGSCVPERSLEHKDSLGNGTVIRPGDVQRMSAGTGILHSEFNPSKVDPVHFLQMWIIPDRAGLPPSYEQKAFPIEERRGRLRLVAGPDNRGSTITMHQDAPLRGQSRSQ